jgi:hypothetical protein
MSTTGLANFSLSLSPVIDFLHNNNNKNKNNNTRKTYALIDGREKCVRVYECVEI